jgi:hypothetical protein
MADDTKTAYRPACQPRFPALCADCSLSYDCARRRDGRLAWPIIVLVLLISAAILV